MRRSFQTAVMCFAFTASAALPAAAQDYPFCIKGCDFGAGRGDCSFSTYQQCQATASGAWPPAYAEIPISRPGPNAQPDRGRPSRRRL